MELTEYKIGLIVTHPKMAAWGPGKIVHVALPKVWVAFRDLPDQEAKPILVDIAPLRKANVQTDPILDNLPPFEQKGDKWVSPYGRRYKHGEAMEWFLARFPKRFKDPRYDEEERGYKVEAHKLFISTLGKGKVRRLLQQDKVEELVRLALKVATCGHVQLLAPVENMAMHDGLAGDKAAAKRFFVTFLDLIDAPSPTASLFEAYAKAVSDLPAEPGKSPVFTWPVTTILPARANPDTFMFLKPNVTNKAAERLGFELHYQSKPNWGTYESLLRMGQMYLEFLRPHGAKDLIDVQSFIWQTGYAMPKEVGEKT